MTDFNTLSAPQVGHRLDGFGVNLLVREVARSVRFMRQVLQLEIARESVDYAVAVLGRQVFQLHADHTYANHPLLSVLPENAPRGGGIELRLFELDPDQAEQRAVESGYTVLQSVRDKPHGLRECFLLDPDGYCWVPSRKI